MATHTRVLIVDAQGPDATLLGHHLAAAGYDADHASTCAEAAARLQRTGSEVVLLALDLGGLPGVTRLASVADGAPLVVLVRSCDPATAREALRLGACDLVHRDDDVDALLFAVERAARAGLLRREVAALRARVSDTAAQSLIGRSAAVGRVRELVGRAAASRMTVLITGEAGTGKDVVARLVHDLSDRSDRPYVTVRCGGVDGEVLEAELFGASRDRDVPNGWGLLETARGGTLVLDEFADVPLVLRARLGQLMAERVLRGVNVELDAGAGTPVPVDVRLIVTSREPLDGARLFAGGGDRIGRPTVLPIALPPLRERRSDIPLLVQHFRARLATESGHTASVVTPDEMMTLLAQQWPGNVRELEHVVERAAVLPAGSAGFNAGTGAAPGAGSCAPGVGAPSFDDTLTLEELERGYILHVLDQEAGHQSRAADRLGIDRRTLYRKLKQYRDSGLELRRAI